VADKGGTMRLGAYACALKDGTKARELYGVDLIQERHRHRFEFNNAYRPQYEAAGMVFSGTNPELNLVEMIELNNHPHFLGCQFHPEFKSKPFLPHPLFAGFVKAAREHRAAGGAKAGAAVTPIDRLRVTVPGGKV
jgi:CTP synthase